MHKFPELDSPEFVQLMRQVAKTGGASQFALFLIRRDPLDGIQVADGLATDDGAIVWWNSVLRDDNSLPQRYSSAETALTLADKGTGDFRLVWLDGDRATPPSTVE